MGLSVGIAVAFFVMGYLFVWFFDRPLSPTIDPAVAKALAQRNKLYHDAGLVVVGMGLWQAMLTWMAFRNHHHP